MFSLNSQQRGAAERIANREVQLVARQKLQVVMDPGQFWLETNVRLKTQEIKVEMRETLVNERGEVIAHPSPSLDCKGGKQKMRRIFSGEFFENQLLDFLLSTFCIPLL